MSVPYHPRVPTMPRDILTEQQCNIEFVKTVEKYPCLFNYMLPTYTRKDVSDKAWEEVAEASNMTPSSCRERWRNLRAVFTRNIKQTVAGTKKKPYYLADAMSFVIPFLQPNMTEEEKQKMQNMDMLRTETSQLKECSSLPLEIQVDGIKVESIDEDDTGQDWAMDTVTTSHKRPKDVEEHNPKPNKMPRTVLQSPSIDTRDPVNSFMNSLLPELRELNTAQFKCFKRRVLELIDDITTEIPTVHNESSYSYEN